MMSDKNHMDIIKNFISHERWRGAFTNIERRFLLADNPSKSFPLLSQHPQILIEGAVDAYERGCEYQAKSIAEKRLKMLSTLEQEGFMVHNLRSIITRCEKERAGRDATQEEERRKQLAIAEEKRQIEKQRELARLLELQDAKDGALIVCNTPQLCQKVFSLAQIFVHENASKKIQIATETIIETYNPTEVFDIGMTVYRLPRDSTEAIALNINCKGSNGPNKATCQLQEIELYRQFKPFIRGFVSLDL